ncbi:lipoyl(octanoyl) transferase LipB [Candidatus Ornithobacterium hominis]|nr:lipoyl(octanoyl) transferase LipB [Candidatus Ornithobacterium hominis]
MMKKSQNKIIEFRDLGAHQAYQETWDFQEKILSEIVDLKMSFRQLERAYSAEKDEAKKQDLAEKMQKIQTPNYLFFLEHSHVYTLGKSGDEHHLLINQKKLNEINATYVKTNRGGDITYHGPEQLVGYPILDLDNFQTDIHWYLRNLEEIIIKTLADYGLKGERSKGETGVWLDVGKPFARKICAMGVKASRWVTMHGFALNVNTDLRYFEYIVPCGIKDKAVTSLQRELNKEVNMVEVKLKVVQYFEEVFNAEIKRLK